MDQLKVYIVQYAIIQLFCQKSGKQARAELGQAQISFNLVKTLALSLVKNLSYYLLIKLSKSSLDKVDQIKLLKSTWIDKIFQFYQLDQPSAGLVKYFTTCPGAGGGRVC